MPRIENLGPNVDEYCKTGNGSSTHDICAECAKDFEEPAHHEKLQPYNGDPQGTIGWAGDVWHPPYSEEDYKCAICDAPLTDEDN